MTEDRVPSVNPRLDAMCEMLKTIHDLNERNKMLEAQIEKLIDFVLSKTECCDVCPITDTCINSEGTCPYVGILSKGEEVGDFWLGYLDRVYYQSGDIELQFSDCTI